VTMRRSSMNIIPINARPHIIDTAIETGRLRLCAFIEQQGRECEVAYEEHYCSTKVR
jgi:hypothetical protein